MKNTKHTRFLIALTAVMLVSIAFVPAVSAQPGVSVIAPTTASPSDAEIRDAVANVIDEIEASDLDPTQKKDLIDEINAIVTGQPIQMDDLKDVLIETGIALYGENGAHPHSNLKWAGFIHNDMAEIAGHKMGLSDSACQILSECADDPDSWSYSINHYALTGAPDEAERLADLARGQIQIGNDDLGYEWLANSLHYMTDMSVPFHYIYEYLANHAAYESYVSSQWPVNTDQSFINSVKNNYYYYYITDVSDSAMNLAAYSHQYMGDIRYTMDHYSNWQDNPALNQYTRNCLVEGAKYNMGLVDYVTR